MAKLGSTNIYGDLNVTGKFRVTDVSLFTGLITFENGLSGTTGYYTSNVGIAGNLNVTGSTTFSSTVTATRFISTQTTGTAPFTVSSTTIVSNLNADLLDGFHLDVNGSNGGPWGFVPLVTTDGSMGVGRYIDFHHVSNDGVDYKSRLHTDGSTDGQLFINDKKIWHSGNSNLTSIPWSASTLTLNGSLSGVSTINSSGLATLGSLATTTGIFSSTLNVSGATNIESTLTTSGLITGNNGISSTYLNLTNNLTITCRDSDRYITFNNASSNTYDWRIGYLGSGFADANYLVFQSNKESGGTYFNALRFGLNTLDATFGGNILPETNNTKTLGSPSYTWNNVYSRYLSVYSESSFAGIINANGGIKISNGTQSVTLTVDSNGVLKLDNASSGASFYATGEISAYGSGTGSTGGGGGSSYNRLDLWSDYSVDKTGYVLSAYLGNDLNSRLSAIEGSGATSITTIGAGNAITSVSKTGNLITFNKDITFLTQNQNITLGGDVSGSGTTSISVILNNVVSAGTYKSVSVNSKGLVTGGSNPTTLSGYGITDAYTKTYIDGYLQKKYAGMTSFGDYTIVNNVITLPSASVRLYSTTGFTGYVYEYVLSSTSFTATTSNIVYFVVANYNSGSPVYQMTTNRDIINYSNIIPVVTLIYDGVKIHSINWNEAANGTAERLNKKLNRTDRFKRESGLSISVDNNRYVTVSPGVVWFGVNIVNYPQAVSSVKPLYQYYHTTTGWTYITSTTLNNTQYDNGTGLSTLSNNKYSINWIYAGVGDDGDIFTLLGLENYDLPTATSAQPPASVPDIIRFHGILVGKVIFQYNVSTPVSVISITDNISTAGGTISEHNNLNGIQGGSAGQYYHLTSLELAAVQEYRTFSSSSGTYTKVTTDSKGKVISGTTLSSSDIPSLDWSKITTGKPTTLNGYGINDGFNISGGTISGSVVISGNLTINGTTTTFNSTTITIDDPILTLGGDTTPTIDDGKDKGIEFRYYDTSAKLGFFGYDNSTGYFSFFKDAVNASETFSGTLGDIQASNFRGALVGNASTATKLNTARAINVSVSGVLGTAQNFDGTTGITIPVTLYNLSGGTHIIGSTYNGSSTTTWSVDATNSNTANKIVMRDGSGNFSAGTITATLTGNASSATKLQTSRTIWGQSFNGEGNVSGAMTNVTSITMSGALDCASTGKFTGNVSGATFYGVYHVDDTRDVTDLPSGITNYSVNFVFKSNSIVNNPPVSNGSSYAHIMNMNGYAAGNSGGGGHNSQLAFGDGLAIRMSSSTSAWGVWRKFWHDGNSNLTSIPWSASTLTLNGSLVGATSGVFSSTLNVSGATNIASTLTTSGLITGNNGISSTYLNLTNNLTITCGNSDRYITFNYASSNTYDWRIGYLGSGAADDNYLVFQSNKESGGTYFNALRFGLNTLDATFGGNILPETTNTKSLGSSSYRWDNIHSRYLTVYSTSTFSGMITANSGITISNGTQSVTLTVDSNGVLKLDNSSSGASFYATGEVSAYGAGTGSTGGGGGSSYNRLDLWSDYSVDKAGYVLSAYLGNDLNSRLSAIESNGATSIVVNGTGDAVTSVSKTGNLITFTKGSTFAPSIGSTSIVNLGVVTAGTWSATDVGLAHGGTNASLTASAGSIVYSTASAMAFSSVGAVGFLLTSNGSGAPTWTSPSTFAPASHNHPYLDLSGATSITTVGTIVTGTWSATDVGLSHGGTNASLSAVAGGVVYSTSSAMAITAAGTSGYLLTSNGSGAPTWASPTAHTHTYASLTGRPSVTRDRYISSGITKTTNITIPNSRTYVVGSNSLLVFRDGLLLAKDTTSSSYDFDYWEVSTTQVRFNYNIPSNSIIEFIIIPI